MGAVVVVEILPLGDEASRAPGPRVRDEGPDRARFGTAAGNYVSMLGPRRTANAVASLVLGRLL